MRALGVDLILSIVPPRAVKLDAEYDDQVDEFETRTSGRNLRGKILICVALYGGITLSHAPTDTPRKSILRRMLHVLLSAKGALTCVNKDEVYFETTSSSTILMYEE